MAIEFLNRDTVNDHIERINRLRPDSARRFGTLDARGMIRHLRWTIEASLGEPESVDESVPVVRTIIWILFFNLFTNWPGGKIKGPPFVTPEPEHDFEEERRLLIDALQRFVDKLDIDPDEKHINPRLGPVPLRKWSQLHGLHNRHHFKQYNLLNKR